MVADLSLSPRPSQAQSQWFLNLWCFGYLLAMNLYYLLGQVQLLLPQLPAILSMGCSLTSLRQLVEDGERQLLVNSMCLLSNNSGVRGWSLQVKKRDVKC